MDNSSRALAGLRSMLRAAAKGSRWPLVATSLLVSARYLLWRTLYTINRHDAAHACVSVVLLAAEFYSFVTLVLFFVQTAEEPKVHRAVPVPDEICPSVDVLVTTYNEPREVVHHTLIGCAALQYPAGRLRVHLLDDGDRPEMRALAESFGFDYIARRDRTHAKAGNLNNALKRCRGELVLILDADHIPVGSFLRETAGFFLKDPKLAFVQAPHHFYNADCYQRNLHLQSELVHEQDLFFQVLMPGRDTHNAAIFAGSSTVMRRSALESIGGFRVETAIEDLHTGMELHARGWRSLYYPRILSGALSPENYPGHFIQRARWTRGGVQLMVLDDPLFKPGLTLRQRLSYFASLIYFMHSLPRLVYLLAPLSYLLLHWNPIVSDTWTLLSYFIPHSVLGFLAFQAVSREYRSPFWSDVYETGTSFILAWTVVATLLRPEKLIFRVTPKGSDARTEETIFRWRMVLPQIALMVLLIAGLIAATGHLSLRRTSLDSYLLSSVWALFNLLLLACSIETAREHPTPETHHRLARRIPCQLNSAGGGAAGVTVNVSVTGALLRLMGGHALSGPSMLELDAGSGAGLLVPCEIVRAGPSGRETTDVAVSFQFRTEDERRSLVRRLFCVSDAWEDVERPETTALKAFAQIAAASLRRRSRASGRRSSRTAASVPCEMISDQRRFVGSIIDLGATRAIVELPNPGGFPERLELQLRGPRSEVVSVPARLFGSPHRLNGSGLVRLSLRFLQPLAWSGADLLGARWKTATGL